MSAAENFRRYAELALSVIVNLLAALRQAGTRAGRGLGRLTRNSLNRVLAAIYEGALAFGAGLNWLRETPERLRRPVPVSAAPLAAAAVADARFEAYTPPFSPPPPGPLEPAYAGAGQQPAAREVVIRRSPALNILLACLILGAVQIGVVALIIFMMRDAGYSSGWGDAARYYLQCEQASQAQQWGQ